MDDEVGTPVAHPAQAALSALDAAAADLRSANLWSLSEADLIDLRIALEASRARVESAVLAVTREVDARGAAVTTGASSTAAWLRGRLRMHPGAAKAEVALAKELDGPLADTGAALAAGGISLDQARSVSAGMHALPGGVDPTTRHRAETYLVEQAGQFDPSALSRLGRHLVLALDPERGAALERAEAELAARQELTLVHVGDGSRRLRGRLGPEAGALLEAAIGALGAPRPAQDGTADPRTPAQRRADALVELVVMAVDSEQMPEHGGEPVCLTVTTRADYLQAATAGTHPGPARLTDGGPGCDSGEVLPPAATLEDGTALSPETARRLGCDAWLVAGILDTDGSVLDIGRMSRTVPRPMRRALMARDGGCAFPGCGRPPRWCHGHHIWHWALGGPTALDNLVLLCGHHHRLIHHDGWQVRLDHRGLPEFTPPPWVDPSQVPRPAWRPPRELLLT